MASWLSNQACGSDRRSSSRAGCSLDSGCGYPQTAEAVGILLLDQTHQEAEGHAFGRQGENSREGGRRRESHQRGAHFLLFFGVNESTMSTIKENQKAIMERFVRQLQGAVHFPYVKHREDGD